MGPGQKPGGNPGMKRRGSRNPGKTLKCLLGYIWKYYKIEFVIVLIAIVISSLGRSGRQPVYKKSDRRLYYTVPDLGRSDFCTASAGIACDGGYLLCRNCSHISVCKTDDQCDSGNLEADP